jgi:hypothetical protein
MSRLTLRLPDSLHRALVRQAERKGVSLNQYLVYLLAQRTTTGDQVRLRDDDDGTRQGESFSRLLEALGPGTYPEIRTALEVREPTEAEPGLTPEVVERLRKRIDETESS